MDDNPITCPFCGSGRVVPQCRPVPGELFYHGTVRCMVCGAQGPEALGGTPQEAKERATEVFKACFNKDEDNKESG